MVGLPVNEFCFVNEDGKLQKAKECLNWERIRVSFSWKLYKTIFRSVEEFKL